MRVPLLVRSSKFELVVSLIFLVRVRAKTDIDVLVARLVLTLQSEPRECVDSFVRTNTGQDHSNLEETHHYCLWCGLLAEDEEGSLPKKDPRPKLTLSTEWTTMFSDSGPKQQGSLLMLYESSSTPRLGIEESSTVGIH